ncbi:hypothetical protein K2P47_01480 [Patescibacteria group bacterium]|nr:hypothetical protein [Patescibacteria group bacterium]
MTNRSVLIRIVTFLTLCIVWYFDSVIIAVPLSVWYLYNFRAYELVLLGLFIDAYFLSSLGLPYYTLSFLAAVIFMELLKPSLRNRDII